MTTWRFEETIDRPADAIWSLAADVGRHIDWMGAAGTMLSGVPDQAGSRVGYVYRMGPMSFDAIMEVSVAEPGRRIAWRIVDGAPFTAQYTLELDALSPSTTRATWSGSLQPRGLWRLLTPLFAMEAREGEARELRKLKALAEAGG
jgi:uncharacterized membrane protein